MRVVIGQDDALYRDGLARLLSEAGFDVVAQARDADELQRKVAGHRPDIVVTEIRMPPNRTDDGLRAAIAIRRHLQSTAVLVLSQYVAQRPAAELIGDSAEGVGYLLKDRVTDLDQFLDAVRRVGRAARRSTRRSLPRCSTAIAAARSTISPPESARCSP